MRMIPNSIYCKGYLPLEEQLELYGDKYQTGLL